MTETLLTLYHGTTLSRAKEITRTGKILAQAGSLMNVCDALKTTPGYVYLTVNPAMAIHYGNMLAIQHQENAFSIYRINLNTAELETDYDEVMNKWRLRPGSFNIENITELSNSLPITQSCRIPRDLHLGTEITHALRMPTNKSSGRTPAIHALLQMKRAKFANDAILIVDNLPWEIIPLPEG